MMSGYSRKCLECWNRGEIYYKSITNHKCTVLPDVASDLRKYTIQSSIHDGERTAPHERHEQQQIYEEHFDSSNDCRNTVTVSAA